MTDARRIAEAFSGHRFPEVYDVLAEDVRWTFVGDTVVEGRRAVEDLCEQTLAALATTTTGFVRFVSIAQDDAAAVDVVARYVDDDGGTTTVSSCDVHEFTGGALTAITSCTVENETVPSGT
ncbi:nuclear transport factor 2 family protein [Blastococcus sp. SYSU D00669]